MNKRSWEPFRTCLQCKCCLWFDKLKSPISMCSKLSDYFNSFAVFGFKQKIIYIYYYVDIVLPASCLFARVCTTYDAMQLGNFSTKSSSDVYTNHESINPYFFFTNTKITKYLYSSTGTFL